jgi:proline racemase
LFGPAKTSGAHARNFVLCPGKAYDRSPCGTGTSAKIACLAADGKLREGDEWVQESIIGSRFTARYRRTHENPERFLIPALSSILHSTSTEDASVEEERQTVVPIITGSAYVIAETRLHLSPNDPFCWGIGG